MNNSPINEDKGADNNDIVTLQTDKRLRRKFKAANRLLNEGRVIKARKKFKALDNLYHDSPFGLIGLAKVENKLGNYQGALYLWNQLIDRQPPVKEAFNGKAGTLVELGRLSEAEQLYEMTLKQWPQCLVSRKGLIKIANLSKDYALLKRRQEEALSADPDDPEIQLAYVRRGLRMDDFSQEEAISQINQIIDNECSETIRSGLLETIMAVTKRLHSEAEQSRLLDKMIAIVDENFRQHRSWKYGPVLAKLCYSRGDMERMLQVVAKLKDVKSSVARNQPLFKIAARLESPDYPDYEAPKVFGIGLSKTGTQSLHHALTRLGFESLHWDNPYTKSLISDQDLFLFDAFSDIGISYQFEALFEKFPNSRFIYTHRSLDDWAKSIQRHYAHLFAITNPSEPATSTSMDRFAGEVRQIEMSLYGKHESWEEAYRSYDSRVKDFFKNVPKNRFLELNICDAQGWERLCPFLQVDIPEDPFPTKNITYRGSDQATARVIAGNHRGRAQQKKRESNKPKIMARKVLGRWSASVKGGYAYNPVPKCGSSTMKASLWKLEADKGNVKTFTPEALKDIHKNTPFKIKSKKVLKNLPSLQYTFTLVRNPYTRVLSAYLGKISKQFNRRINKNFSKRYQVDCKQLTFPQFVELIARDNPCELNRHWMPMSLVSGIRIHEYSHIGKLEAFGSFQAHLEKAIGLKPSHITVINTSAISTSDLLSQYYDDATIRLVDQLYLDDFKNFNYTMGDLVNLKGGEIDYDYLKSNMLFNLREELEIALSANQSFPDVYSRLISRAYDL